MGETEDQSGFWIDSCGRTVHVIHHKGAGRVHVTSLASWTCCDEHTFERWKSWGWKRAPAGRSLLKENPNG